MELKRVDRVDKEMLRERFVAAGLEQFWPSLEPLFRASVKVSAALCPESSLEMGASKRGGVPDLPVGFVWPERDRQPCEFLCQINLAQVAPYDTEKLLPESGLLSFFLCHELGMGELNGDPVFYFPEGVPLERSPMPQESPFGVQALSFDFTWTFPGQGSSKRSFLGRRSESEAAFEEVMETLYDMTAPGAFETMAALAVIQGEATLTELLQRLQTPPTEPFDPLLGCVSFGATTLLSYPDDYQGDQEPTCELIYRGVIPNTYADYPENYRTLYDEAEPQAYHDWICLLDTSDGAGVFSLSYCIRREDLEGWDFTKTVMIAVN